MNNLEQLLKHYQSLLADNGIYSPDEVGMLSYNGSDGVPKPVTIKGDRLCLPTNILLKEGNWDGKVVFHPASEQVGEGPSPVLNLLKDAISITLKHTIINVSTELMIFAADPSRHKGKSAEIKKFLAQAIHTEADAKTVENLAEVFAAVGNAPEKRLISLFLKNGGNDGVLRTCVVNYPIMDDQEPDDMSMFFGVKMKRKSKPQDKALIKGVLEYVVGNAEERAAATQGSKSREAPYYHALLLSFQYIAKRINGIVDTFKETCPKLSTMTFNLDWTEDLKDFDTFADKIGGSVGTLPGNRGVSNNRTETKPTSVEKDTDDKTIGVRDLLSRKREVEDTRDLRASDRLGLRDRRSTSPRIERSDKRNGTISIKDLLGRRR